MKKFTLATVLLAFGFQGCFLPVHHPDPTITFHADRSFSSAERQCLDESADIWAKQTNGVVRVGYKYDYNPHNLPDIITHNSDDRLVRWTSDMQQVKDVEQREDPDGFWMMLGQTSQVKPISERTTPVEVRLVMDRLTDPHICKLTAIHEFGHAFGLPHIKTHVGNVMWPSVVGKRTECLKPDELLYFCMENNCGTVQMSPCPDQPELDPVDDSEAMNLTMDSEGIESIWMKR